MKRTLGMAAASTLLAGTAGLFLVPSAAHADPNCYPCTPAEVVAAVANETGQTLTQVGDELKLVLQGLKPGSLATFYGFVVQAQSPVRYALLQNHAASVLASAPELPSAAGTVSLGTAVADANGTAQLVTTIPASLVGKVQITMVGTAENGQPVSKTVSLTVNPAGTRSATSGTSGLPFTGSDSLIPLTLAGVGALAVGSGLVVVARRRRVAEPAV